VSRISVFARTLTPALSHPMGEGESFMRLAKLPGVWSIGFLADEQIKTELRTTEHDCAKRSRNLAERCFAFRESARFSESSGGFPPFDPGLKTEVLMVRNLNPLPMSLLPVHPALVHLPIAFVLLSVGADLTARLTKSEPRRAVFR